MDFIDDLILEHIKEIGVGRVFVVCMDGSWKDAFVLIQKELPWVQCFVCPTQKHWILDGVHQDAGKRHGRRSDFRDGVE